MKRKPDDQETTSLEGGDTAVTRPQETATLPPPEKRKTLRVPFREPRADYSRANPRAKPVRVIRSWPGTTNGQLIVLTRDREKRLIKAGFVEKVDA